MLYFYFKINAVFFLFIKESRKNESRFIIISFILLSIDNDKMMMIIIMYCY